MDHLDKDEVLRRAQARKGEDEMEEHVGDRANLYGIMASCAVFLVLFLLNYFTEQPSSDISAVLSTMLAATYLYKWHRLRKRLYLLVGITCLVSGLLALAAYIQQLFF